MRILSLTALLLAVTVQAAPGLPEKPPKWEYAEVTFRTTPARPGGLDPNGNEVAPTPATVTIRWITATGEAEMKGWAEMAEKLKVAAFKKDGSAALQKLQMLNFLGGEGWELIEQQSGSTVSGFRGDAGPARGPVSTATGSWLFKRRVP